MAKIIHQRSWWWRRTAQRRGSQLRWSVEETAAAWCSGSRAMATVAVEWPPLPLEHKLG